MSSEGLGRHTNTLVSSGSDARTLFRAECISEAVPSKNLPQPRPTSESVTIKAKCRSRTSATLTTVEQRVAREDDLVIAILHKPADAVLRVAGGMQTLHRDATQRKHFTMSRRLGHSLAVLASKDLEVRKLECGALFRTSASAPLHWASWQSLQASSYLQRGPSDYAPH